MLITTRELTINGKKYGVGKEINPCGVRADNIDAMINTKMIIRSTDRPSPITVTEMSGRNEERKEAEVFTKNKLPPTERPQTRHREE